MCVCVGWLVFLTTLNRAYLHAVWFAFLPSEGIYACMHVFCVQMSWSVSLSVSSFLQQRAATAAGVIHVSVPRTVWLCWVVGNNTGRKQVLLWQIYTSTFIALRMGKCYSRLVTDNHWLMILMVQFRLAMPECVCGLMICRLIECHAKPRGRR